MSKYKPLSDRLSGHEEPQWRASFSELEDVLGFPLPKGAKTGRTWWSDEKRSWRDHGWRADDIDHDGGYVTFKRDGQTTAAVAEDIVMPPEAPAVGALPRASFQPVRRAKAAAPIIAGVAVLAGVAALITRTVLRRRSS